MIFKYLLFFCFAFSWAQTTYELDSNFAGGDGIFLEFGFDTEALGSFKIKEHPAGGFILAGQRITPSDPYASFVAKMTEDGTIDTSFGNAGFVSIDVTLDNGLGIEVLNDGKILVYGGVGTVKLIRLNADGSLDASFGNAGEVVIDNATADDNFYLGALFVDGNDYYIFYEAFTNSNNESLAKYNSTGDLDTSFGVDGIVEDVQNSQTIFRNQNTGYFYGFEEITTTANLLQIVRYTPSGQLDTSFGTAGIKQITTPSEVGRELDAVLIDSENRILFYDFEANLVFRITENGDFDTTFGNAGLLSLSFTDFSIALTNLYEIAGKYVLIGVKGNADFSVLENLTIARLNTDGTFDTSFDVDGIYFDSVMTEHIPENAIFRSDNSVVLAGQIGELGSGNLGYFVAKLNETSLSTVENPNQKEWQVNTLFNNQIRVLGNVVVKKMELFSLDGKRVLFNENKSYLSTAGIPQGVYFLLVTEQNGQASTIKVLKK